MDENDQQVRFNFTGITDSLRHAADRASAMLSRYARNAESVSRKVSKATSMVSKNVQRLTGLAMGYWFSKGIAGAIDYTETLNLFNVAMGDSIEMADQFISKMSELYGMDPKNLMDTAGTFYLLNDAIGLPEKTSEKMSLNLTKAANDIASLYNKNVERVVGNLQSGMMGMSRAVKAYGYDVTAASIKQTAMNYGITQSVETMSEGNKRLLRYITLMEQMSAATRQVVTDEHGATQEMGDFAQTIEEPANQLRIFREQMAQLGRAIGNFFVAPLRTAMAYINGFVMALRMAINFIGSLFGLLGKTKKVNIDKTADKATEAIEGVGGAAGGAAKELENMLAPFDEINRLEVPDIGGGGGAGGGAEDILDPVLIEAVENMDLKLEEIQMKATKIRNTILEFLGFKVEEGTILGWDAKAFETNLINKFPKWTKTIQATFSNWTNIVEGFKAVWKSLVKVFQTVKQKVFDFLAQYINDTSVSDWINNLGNSLQNLSTWINDNASTIANWIIALTGVRVLMPVISVLVTALIGGIQALLTAVGGISLATFGWIAAAVALIAVLVDLWNTDDEFRAEASEGWRNLVKIVSSLWNTVLYPTIKAIGKVLRSLYEGIIKPIVKGISELVLALWNNILAPVVNWIVNDLGPVIGWIVNFIADQLGWVFDFIGGIISGILQMLKGVIQFISGVFSADISKVLEGLQNMFVGFMRALGNLLISIVNAAITVINGAVATVWGLISWLLQAAAEAINTVGRIFGRSWNLSVSATPPQLPTIPAMANGGVVTGPTTALIGEGRYDEAVIPLGNSPQMRDLVNAISEKTGGGEQVQLLREQNSLLRAILDKTGINIDGRELSDIVTGYQRRDARALGV